ncbi:MAG: AsmA family protein [Candidatus Omnitrophica bacterium]|nr:AsmA family protein [Candidatus Omnitrophota bacterium]MDD5610338.1 AsmA family protein [Candidatus Omnitrophota bacterium]
MGIIKKFVITLGAVFLLIIALFIGLFFFIKNIEVKNVLEKEIERTLGINVTIEKIEFSPLAAHIEISGITIDNPKGFAEKELAYISSIHFVFDPIEIIARKKPNIYLFVLNIKRLNIVKNKDGKVNIKELVPVEKWNVPVEAKTPFYFDAVVLSIDEINYTEYGMLGKKISNYPVAIKNATFLNVNDENDMVKLVVYRAMMSTDVGKFINLSVVPMVSQVSGTVGAAWEAAKFSFNSVLKISTAPFRFLFEKGQ